MIALVRVASTANIASLSGLGTAVDGVTLSAGNRVLVKNQNTPSQNGIYLAASGSWSRASDPITAGLLCYVQEGTVNTAQSYIVSTHDPITLGTTSLSFNPAPKDLLAESLQINGSALVHDVVAATVTGNILVLPNTANVILLGADELDGVSNVKQGAIYYLVATASVVLYPASNFINSQGVEIALSANDVVQVIGLESNKVAVVSAPHLKSEHFALDVNGDARVTGALSLGGSAGSDNATIKVESDGSNLTLISDIGGKIRFDLEANPDPDIANARSWDMVVVGRGTYYHFLQVNSGLEKGFAHQSDHSHIEQNIHTPPNLNEAMRGVTQLLRGRGNTNSVTLAGKPAFMKREPHHNDEVGRHKHSIDTSNTTASTGDYLAELKLRFTAEGSLAEDDLIQLEITGPVAGIQAANYSGKVTQAPTLISGLWEVLIEVAGFDPEHWEPDIGEDTTLFKQNWTLHKVLADDLLPDCYLTAGYEGRADQLLVEFLSAHALNWGEAVVLNVVTANPGTMTGLTARAHSGYVSKVITNTKVAIVIGDIQEPYTHLPMTGSTNNTLAYHFYRGNVDPPHQVVLGSQNWTFWRDQKGVTTRYQVGLMTEATATYSAAYGIDVWNGTSESVEIGYGNFSKINISLGHARLNSGADFTKGVAVQDTKAVAISSNNLAFPDDANVILVGTGTINTVSNVKAGAVYHLVATGSVTLTDGSLIVCKGSSNVTLAVDESVTVIGLESNKISVIS